MVFDFAKLIFRFHTKKLKNVKNIITFICNKIALWTFIIEDSVTLSNETHSYNIGVYIFLLRHITRSEQIFPFKWNGRFCR